MEIEAHISVTLVYSLRSREVIELVLDLQAGCSAAQAVHASGLLARLTPAEVDVLQLGVWGRKVHSSHVLRANDRVELYRPLTVDPKVARRERFVRQGAKSAGLFSRRRAGAKAGY